MRLNCPDSQDCGHSFKRVMRSVVLLGNAWGVYVLWLILVILTVEVRSENATLRWRTAINTSKAEKESPVSQKEESIALCMVYDTSSSMSSKISRGNQALLTMIEHVGHYVEFAPKKRQVEAGLVVFTGLAGGIYAVQGGGSRVKFAVEWDRFDAQKLQAWVNAFNRPGGATPLGKAVEEALRPLSRSMMTRKILVLVTDGGNNTGQEPSAVIQRFMRQASNKKDPISCYCIKVESEEVSNTTLDSLRTVGVKMVHDLNKDEMDQMLREITKTN